MYARVTMLQGERLGEEQLEQVRRYLQERVVAPIRQQQGCRGAYFLIDPASGKSLSVTIWESEQAMQASESVGNQTRSQSAQDFGLTIQGVERYRVVAQL